MRTEYTLTFFFKCLVFYWLGSSEFFFYVKELVPFMKNIG